MLRTVSMRPVSPLPQQHAVSLAPGRVEYMADEFRFGSLIDVRHRGDSVTYRYQRGSIYLRGNWIDEVEFGRDPDAVMSGEVANYALYQGVGRFMDSSGSPDRNQSFTFQRGEVHLSRGRFQSMTLLDRHNEWRDVPGGVIQDAYEKNMGQFVQIQKLPFGKKGYVFEHGTIVNL